ncbi:MAG: recombinase family protein [Lachnospiraceae bacterium]|nr:recombinase family protein [Lachnospiraceae bacterium]
MRTIGYCRVSRPQQNIERQIRNIKSEYPDAIIVSEKYSCRTQDRPEWLRVLKQVDAGKVDRIVFDSVSRMSRNAEDGLKQYEDLLSKGIDLVFLKEPQINTAVYQQALQDAVPMTGTDVDDILKGVNSFIKKLRRSQIMAAFQQSEKEVQDNRARTREGIETARLHGKQIGRPVGAHVTVKKKEKALQDIRKYNKSFGGSLNDQQTMQLAGISSGTFYKYKKELLHP